MQTSTAKKDTVFLQMPLFFHTPIVDDNVALIVELVAQIKEHGIVAQEMTVAWGLLRLFKALNFGKTVEDVPLLSNSMNEDGDLLIKKSMLQDAILYSGTPRALFFLSTPPDAELAPRLGCTLTFALFRHLELQKALHLFKANDMCDEQVWIPGLKRYGGKIQVTSFKVPELVASSALRISNIRITVPHYVEAKLMAHLEEKRRTTQGKSVLS